MTAGCPGGVWEVDQVRHQRHIDGEGQILPGSLPGSPGRACATVLLRASHSTACTLRFS